MILTTPISQMAPLMPTVGTNIGSIALTSFQILYCASYWAEIRYVSSRPRLSSLKIELILNPTRRTSTKTALISQSTHLTNSHIPRSQFSNPLQSFCLTSLHQVPLLFDIKSFWYAYNLHSRPLSITIILPNLPLPKRSRAPFILPFNPPFW